MWAYPIFLPVLNTQSGYLVMCGIAVFILSACMRSPKTASRCQAIAFCVFTSGSVMMVKTIAEAYQK